MTERKVFPPPTEPGPPKGLECRKCGCLHFYVVYTRPQPGGVIMRLRECRHCGRRILTRERAE